ncbi:MAG: ABC transporter permease subunit [Oscillospiraceae bacterium]|nr:ABC transporter permease subunit [Oscillospiraceae bacterium]
MKQIDKIGALLPHLIFAVTFLVILLIKDGYGVYNHISILIFIVGIEVICIFYSLMSKSKALLDSFAIVFVLLLLWELFSLKLRSSPENLFPPPERIIEIFEKDYRTIIDNITVSLKLLGKAYFFALTSAIPIGIFAGAKKTLKEVFLPIAKILSPIPPIIYVPYAVIFLKSFEKASLFIVFIGVFWGMFLRMVYTVAAIDKHILLSAESLNIGKVDKFFCFWLPYALPQIFSGISLTLPGAFMCLIFAETLNGRNGIGFYTRFHSQFGNYDRIFAGIIVDAVLIIFLNLIVKKLKTRLIRY